MSSWVNEVDQGITLAMAHVDSYLSDEQRRHSPSSSSRAGAPGARFFGNRVCRGFESRLVQQNLPMRRTLYRLNADYGLPPFGERIDGEYINRDPMALTILLPLRARLARWLPAWHGGGARW